MVAKKNVTKAQKVVLENSNVSTVNETAKAEWLESQANPEPKEEEEETSWFPETADRDPDSIEEGAAFEILSGEEFALEQEKKEEQVKKEGEIVFEMDVQVFSCQKNGPRKNSFRERHQKWPIGGSLFFPNINTNNMHQKLWPLRVHDGMKFQTRKTVENGVPGVRVWRRAN